MYQCGTCWKAFPAGARARDNHCDSTGHDPPTFECETCPRVHDTHHGLMAHMRDLDHFYERYECTLCYDRFQTSEQQKQHEVYTHYYCQDCDREFMNLNNINQHLNSRTHRGTDIECPFCYLGFATATGVAHHVETGACPRAKNVNRDELYRFIRAKDPEGVISKKLIGWTGSDEYEATNLSWNGEAYECYFCHREFNRLSSLQQHLSSPIHQQKLYHCPNISCRKEFVSLAGIINHFESESCGFMRFEKVQLKFSNIMTSNRRLQF